ncbi:MAG: hypothetical protein LC746_02190, partial [Acidobacteria bacterium]|nr:hypothetical protein [Acidobacteriota bacterium]
MKSLRTACVLVFALALVGVCAAQKRSKTATAQPTTGGVRGRVKVDPSSTPGGVRVTLRRGEEEVTRVETGGKG